ncbi:MAG: FtsX-like permease family protein, partial [Bacteroidales bacterium]
IPGLSDAGNCRDWETSIPVDLTRIRKKDEDYWNDHLGTPKAFINLDQAISLWQNRFGSATQVRFAPGSTRDEIESALMAQLQPADLGLVVTDPRQVGLRAAGNGVDFGQLFLGLSFFLALSGIILSFLLIQLNLLSRSHHIGTLRAIGWPGSRIRELHLGEGLLVSILGLLLGLGLTWLYNILVFKALNTIWNDIVLTDSLKLYFRPRVVAIGLGAGLAIALATQVILVNRFLRRDIAAIQRRREQNPAISSSISRKTAILGLSALSSGLIIWQVLTKSTLQPLPFLLAGSMILAALLLAVNELLIRWNRKGLDYLSPAGFFRKSLARNRNRSLSVVTLFSIGVFLTIAIGANRKDAGLESGRISGGTGGFLLFAETTVPILENLNDKEVRHKAALESDFEVVQMKKQDGDDASCLNLNQVSQPPLLGVPSGALDGRFTFARLLPGVAADDPWQSLGKPLPGGAVPAFADQTVIQWGLGLQTGDTLHYLSEAGDSVKVVLIGGLANSIFQGNLLVSADVLDQLYPSNSGSRVFLFDGPADEAEEIESEFIRIYRDHGIGLEPATVRLARFNSIENTYLSIFLIMGTLGMLLGTLGLGIILLRNLQERAPELALFRAAGFSRTFITGLVFGEYATLLSIGTLVGGIASIISVIPGILSPTGEVSLWMLLLILLILIGNGLAWVFLLARSGIGKIRLAQELKNE